MHFPFLAKANYTKQNNSADGAENVSFSYMLLEIIRASNPHYYLGSVPKEESLYDTQQPHSSRAS